MRSSVFLSFALLLGSLAQPALADLIPPQVAAARERLHANPEVFDRTDQFCAGKTRDKACTIDGSTFSGGGAGVCRSEITDSGASIDLVCRRSSEPVIDRRLPDGGYVNDPGMCAASRQPGYSGPPVNCKPTVPTPADRFCREKAAGSACTVELIYEGKTETHEGICNQVTESTGFYYQGRRSAVRQVIRCDPPSEVKREMNAVKWYEKLLR